MALMTFCGAAGFLFNGADGTAWGLIFGGAIYSVILLFYTK